MITKKYYTVYPFKRNFDYTILLTKTISEGIELLKSMPRKKTFSRKHILAELAEESTKCVCCNRVATKFCLGQGSAAGTKDRGDDLHWDLYTDDGIAMSIDHIVPKSKGGANNKANAQLMCIECNNIKGNLPNRLIPYKHLIDANYQVVAWQKAGKAFIIVGNHEFLPQSILDPIKDYLIENLTEYEGKPIYYFNDEVVECLVESE